MYPYACNAKAVWAVPHSQSWCCPLQCRCAGRWRRKGLCGCGIQSRRGLAWGSRCSAGGAARLAAAASLVSAAAPRPCRTAALTGGTVTLSRDWVLSAWHMHMNNAGAIPDRAWMYTAAETGVKCRGWASMTSVSSIPWCWCCTRCHHPTTCHRLVAQGSEACKCGLQASKVNRVLQVD